MFPEQLEPLRQVGDPMADECMKALDVKPGSDALDIIGSYLSQPICEQCSKAPRIFQENITTVPEWVDWDLIHQGQNVYWYEHRP